jgi:CHAD domain-containing protein
MRLDPELLDGPPAAGAQVMALARCADVREAAARVADPADQQALHDLRVALRRLRGMLQALAPLLGAPLPEKQLRRLRKAARLTGPARDAEVLLAWLQAAREGLPAPYRGALDWLLERVEAARARAAVKVADRALPRLERALPRLVRRLARPAPRAAAPRPAAPQGSPATLAAALVPLLRARAAALREALLAVAGDEDVPAIHAARIQGKRLRYLLEPLRGLPEGGAEEAVVALKGLQDVLGDWHDAHAARSALQAALNEAAADRARWRGRGGGDADFRPGLLALERLAAARAAAHWTDLEAGYLGGRARPLLDLAYAVVAALEARGAEAAPAVPERKLLLTALPSEVAGGEVEEIEQGWLPGATAQESVGQIRSALGERHFRARAAGRGAAGVEPLARGDFEALWPLTEGRRVARRSHRSQAEPAWRFDEYLDRRLVLAVAEAGQDVPPPWLEPLVVREVTLERGYTDEALARRPARRAAPDGAAGPG